MVILIPFCRTETGKIGDGYVVHHSRKSLSVESGLSDSQICSRRDMKLGAK